MVRAARHLEREHLEAIAVANGADSSAIANTTTETTFDVSGVIPAHEVRDGAVFRIFLSGRYSTALSGPTLRIRASIGGVEVFDTGAVAVSGSVTSAQWRATLLVVERDGALLVGLQESIVGAAVGNADVQSTGVLTWTQDQQIEATAQWGTADAANTTTLELLTVERLA